MTSSSLRPTTSLCCSENLYANNCFLDEGQGNDFHQNILHNLERLTRDMHSEGAVDPKVITAVKKNIELLRARYLHENLPEDSHLWSELYRAGQRLDCIAGRVGIVPKLSGESG